MNNSYRPLFFLLFTFLSFNTVLYSVNTAQIFKIHSIADDIKLNKFWKYHAGDDTLWASFSYDDSDWDTISTILNLKEIPEDKFQGNAWFRLHIKIDPSLKNTAHALTINQQGASGIYLNGKQIAKAGTVGIDTILEKTYNPNHIPFLIEFRDSLDYVLAVRYSNLKAFSNFKKYKIKNAGFNIRLMNYNSASRSIANIGKMRVVVFIVFTVFIVIAFLHLLLFLFYRRQKSNLYFFLFMVSISTMWLLALSSMSVSNDPGFSMKSMFHLKSIIVLSFSLLSIFVYSIFYPKFPKTAWIVIGLIPIIFLLHQIQLSWTGKILRAANLLILIDIIRVIIVSIIKKKKGAWIIGLGFLLFVLFFAIILVTALGMNKDNVTTPGNTMGILMLATFLPGIVSIPVSMSIFLARDFATTSKNLEKQLKSVKILSAKTIEQEKEKQRILENQKEKLETMVDERTKELAAEKEKTEELLLNTLPLKVVNELKEKGKSEPESFDNVTVYFSDIVGFTNISSTLEPKKLIAELNEMFTVFDDIMEKHQCERIKTIGDAYLAVSGMPLKNIDHAENMVNASIEIKNYLEDRNNSSEVKWRIRIGIHTGKVVGGIVGVRKYIYDVFGDTINTASRMESNSEPMRINVSETTYKILKGKYDFIERETINVKGKGSMKMFFLNV